MKPAYPIAALFAAAPTPAWALALHVAVLSDPHDGPNGVQGAASVARVLTSSGAYDAVPVDRLGERLGGDPGALFRSCGDDEACWREAGAAMRVEALILVERLDTDIGVRTLVVADDSAFRRDFGPEGADHGPPADLIERMFFRPGELTVTVNPAPDRARLRIDGNFEVPLEGGSAHVDAISPGKHAVEVLGLDSPFFSPVVVLPGTPAEVRFEIVATRPSRPRWQRWTTGVAAGIVVAAIGMSYAAAAAPIPARVPHE